MHSCEQNEKCVYRCTKIESVRTGQACTLRRSHHIYMLSISMPYMGVCTDLSTDAWEGQGVHVSKMKNACTNVQTLNSSAPAGCAN